MYDFDPSLPTHVLRARRPIIKSGWFGTLSEEAWNLAGANFDFLPVDCLTLTLLGTTEIFNQMRVSKHLGKLPLAQFIKSAKQATPSSFREPIELKPQALDIVNFNEPDGRNQTNLVVNLDESRTVEDERLAIVHSIDVKSAHWHAWASYAPRIKLAVLTTSDRPLPEVLDELFSYVPETISADRGVIDKAIVQPSLIDH